jgi:hypothetical protein
MHKNFTTIAYALLVSLFITGMAYNAGYNAKHTPKYIHIKYENISNNLFKVLQDCGIQTSKDQQQAVFERLKLERGSR